MPIQDDDTQTSPRAWRRWIDPLRAAIDDDIAPLDLPAMEENLASLAGTADPVFAQKLLATAKPAYQAMRKTLREMLERTGDGAIYVGRHSRGMDLLLGAIMQVLCARHSAEDVALIAVGGYGRGELAPNSDIDLLFLTEKHSSKGADDVVEQMLYLLWDMGLKVGHAKRTVTTTMRAAREDHTILTSLLEIRFIAGNKRISANLARAFRREVNQIKAADFAEVKLAERDARHARHGNTRYVVEPNIKEGKGGLRDLHTLFWIAKFAYRADSIIALVEKGVLRESEARRFAAAQRFLWTVRCHIHLRADRPDERLDFEAQMVIAPLMGFADRGGMRAVERFMKRYYLAALNVGNLTRIMCAAMEMDFRQRRTKWREELRFGQSFGPFTIRAGRINLDQALMFRDEPLRMLTLFELALEPVSYTHLTLPTKRIV